MTLLTWVCIMLPLAGVWLLFFTLVRLLLSASEKKRAQTEERRQRDNPRLFDKAATRATPEEIAATRDVVRGLYARECERRIGYKRQNAGQRQNDALRRASAASLSMAEAARSVEEGSAVLDGLLQQQRETEAAAAEDFDRMAAMEQVSAVKPSEGSVVVLTKPLEIEHAGRMHVFGPFAISIELGNGLVTVRNLDGSSRRIHPHVDENGRLLMQGDMLSALLSYISSYRISDAVAIIIGLLQSYDESTALTRIEEFAQTTHAAA